MNALRAETPRKRVAIIQSGYLPWKGYFDIIREVDEFLFLDDVQYTVRDWRNRNRAKTPGGTCWLTVPVGHQRDRAIDQVVIPTSAWQERHWKTFAHFYRRAPHFPRYEAFFRDVYLGRRWERLSELNQFLIIAIAREFLGIATAFLDARPFAARGAKTDRLLELLEQRGATDYHTGPTTRAYLDVPLLNARGIEVSFKDYAGYPEHPQFFPPFSHVVSVVDLLFHTGPEAPWYIWGWRDGPRVKSRP